MGTTAKSRVSARDALVSTTIGHLAKFGPVGTQPQDVCAELGISKALVNYHFGGREGLIAEALTVAYEARSKEMAEVAWSVQMGASATAALESMIESHVRWGGEHPGLQHHAGRQRRADAQQRHDRGRARGNAAHLPAQPLRHLA